MRTSEEAEEQSNLGISSQPSQQLPISSEYGSIATQIPLDSGIPGSCAKRRISNHSPTWMMPTRVGNETCLFFPPTQTTDMFERCPWASQCCRNETKQVVPGTPPIVAMNNS
eukprot:CAMPEP_0177556708 /NCGR_PEP_ID=MMETSP0369-20130122/69222_1 /TAXON_ID=447022 ORGANISM="Scrippsiella hangoei-like, Strain SHHI-4" /NCGR_SAMPLE_ID=MMETSP0369 /ASSEMBLY_ACC=CAM_ASM_000364 /LENGTH=111 /DNA_ID=CAMNT_0019042939 /DNA_START=96 /DNA_END=431 /DNA_ORIENTATION=+